MSIPIATATRQQIRQGIGDNIGAVIISTASTTGTPTTLSDQYALIKGGQNEYLGWQAMVNSSGTAAADYAKRFVTASSAGVITLSAALAATTVSGNAYELWKPPYTIEQINNLIAQAEKDAANQVLVEKMDATTFTQMGRYLYTMPAAFVGIHTLEYDEGQSEYETIEDCDSAWNESVTVGVTVTADSDFRKGETWLKVDVAAAAATTGFLVTQAISALDLRDCTEVEMSVYCTVAIAASAMQLGLDDTAACASTTEGLNFPATAASTQTRHIISLANPESDGAIISVGLKMAVDLGAFTFYTRKIKAVRANSRRFEPLMPEYWDIVRGATDYLSLTPDGKAVTGNDCLLRVKGYRILAPMSSETSVSQIDAGYLIDRVSGDILLTHNPTAGEKVRGQQLADEAERKRRLLTTNLYAGTRFI